jgi:hypothetical protein
MWIQRNNELSFSASEIKALEEIPVRNWLLKQNMDGSFYLEEASSFKLPAKVYGDSEKIANRYLNTFRHKNSNLGVLLTGMKGTGKSVTAKITCMNSDLPVILITEPFRGDGFKSFLSNITQPVIVFIDEFEKVYFETSLQNGFLSILDGIFEGKKLFLFTSNEKGNINQYMINRPGRVHYLREYNALEMAIVEEFIDDNLINKDHKNGLLEVISILGNITMDTLTALIAEMNLYKETAREAIKEVNLRPEKVSYDVEVINKENVSLGTTWVSEHPLAQELLSLNVYCSDITSYKGGASNHDSVLAELLKYYKSKKVVKATVAKKSEHDSEDDSGEEIYDEESGDYIPGKEQGAELSEIAELSDMNFTSDLFKKQAGLYKRIEFRLSIEDIEVKQSKEGIDILDTYGNTFKFKKSKNYSYSF